MLLNICSDRRALHLSATKACTFQNLSVAPLSVSISFPTKHVTASPLSKLINFLPTMPPNYWFPPSLPLLTSSCPSACPFFTLQGPIIAWCLSHQLSPPHCLRHSFLTAENWYKSGCSSVWSQHKDGTSPFFCLSKIITLYKPAKTGYSYSLLLIVSSNKTYHLLGVILFHITHMDAGFT